MIQYTAVLTACLLVALLLAKPELVKPIAATIAVSADVQDDIPIGSLSNSPVGETVSVSGVLMELDRESDDAVLLTFADSSGSVTVPYLDPDGGERSFEVGTAYRIVGIVVGKGSDLFLVPQEKDDIRRISRSPSELLSRRTKAVATAVPTPRPTPNPAPPRTEPARVRSGHYVVLASPGTRTEADMKVAEYSPQAKGNVSVIPKVVNSETRYRVVVGPFSSSAEARRELRNFQGIVEGVWITRM